MFKRYRKRIRDNAAADPQYIDEHDDVINTYWYAETSIWLRRAEAVHVDISDIPLTEGRDSHWWTDFDGAERLHADTLRKLSKLVELAEYERSKRQGERWEMTLKWYTALVGSIAAIGSVWNIFFIQKH